MVITVQVQHHRQRSAITQANLHENAGTAAHRTVKNLVRMFLDMHECMIECLVMHSIVGLSVS
jgi:hypothetical protein